MRDRINRLIRMLLTMFGALFIGVFLHEIYHTFTLHNISEICIEFGGQSFMYVRGEGSSSELVAYIITFSITLAGIIFAFKDLNN